MAITNIPNELQLFIYNEKENYLRDCLQNDYSFRAVAIPEPVSVGHGETVTKFKDSLLVPNDQPVNGSTLYSNLDNGMTSGQRRAEQFSLTIQAFDGTLDLRKTDNVAKLIPDYMNNAKALVDQARLSMDLVAMRSLFAPYNAGQTFVTAAGSSDTSVAVDDVTGFENLIAKTGVNCGVPTAVSGSNTIAATIAGGAVTITGVSRDGTNTSSRKAFGGASGVLTLQSSRVDALGEVVTVPDKSRIVRPFSSGTERASDLAIVNGDFLTMRMIKKSVTEMRRNRVPTIAGKYNLYTSPNGIDQLFLDSEFQALYNTGGVQQTVIQDFTIYTLIDCRIIVSNILAPQAAVSNGASSVIQLERSIMVGAGALIEGRFADEQTLAQWAGGSDSSLKLHDCKVVDGISFIDRAPMDRLALAMAQSWVIFTGWSAPTDALIDSTVLPTSTSARYKRAISLVHAGQ